MKTTKSSDYIYNEIKEEIMFLKLFPGQTVNEVETAERFNVSRTPVRDAFKRLEVEGLIKVERGNGTFVSLIDIDEIDDIMYIRKKLETAVVKEIGSLSKSQQIKLELLVSKQKELLDSNLDDFESSQKSLEYDNELHETLFIFANKINVWKRISNDKPHYNRLRVLINLHTRNQQEKLYEEHSQIVECIIKQDYENIEDYYRNHIYRGMNNLSEIVSKNREYFMVS